MQALIRFKLLLTLVTLLMIAAAMAIPLALSGGHSHAAAPKARHAVNANTSSAFRGQPNSLLHVRLGHPTISINPRDDGRLLYVDDGACPGPGGNTGDSIDVYSIHKSGLVHLGNFPTGGCSSSGIFGTQDLDVTPANGTHGPCLVYADFINSFVDSFPILSGGALGAQVSHLANSTPQDVHISQNGQLVYIDSLGISSQFASYSLGKGCVLTALTTLPFTQSYESFALINATRLLTVDSHTGNIDTYALTSTGGISLLNSVPGQISFPDSVAYGTTGGNAKGTTDVFTGQAVIGPPPAQGGIETVKTGAISFLAGSPARAPSGSDGAVVLFDYDQLLLVQGEQFSCSLAVYQIKQSKPASMAFFQQTPLASRGGCTPTDFARMDQALFVAAGAGGDVETCLINSSGVSGCATAAILTNATGFEGGIVLL